jgi:hypothetical protein
VEIFSAALGTPNFYPILRNFHSLRSNHLQQGETDQVSHLVAVKNSHSLEKVHLTSIHISLEETQPCDPPTARISGNHTVTLCPEDAYINNKK